MTGSASPIVVVYAGINDIGNSIAPATTQANLKAIYDQLRAAGKIVITATMGTSLSIAGSSISNTGGIASGVTSFTAPAGASAGDVLILGPGTANQETVTVQSVSGAGPYTITLAAATTKAHAQGDLFRNTTRLGYLNAVNQWIIDYCRGRYTTPGTTTVVTGGTPGIHLVDWHTPCTDPATGQPTTTATVDGTHPTQDLAHLMGLALANVLDRLLPPMPVRSGDNADATNLLPNGRMVGNSGGLATSWAVSASSGSITYTPSKVARSDGMPGEVQQIKVGPGNTGQLQLYADVSGLTFDGTAAYVMEAEFETDADLLIQGSPPGGSVPLQGYLAFRDSGGQVAAASSHAAASGTDGSGTIWDASGVLRTGRVVPPATANRIQAFIRSGGVDTGTFRVLSARVRKVA